MEFVITPKFVDKLTFEDIIVERHADKSVRITDRDGTFSCVLKEASASDTVPKLMVEFDPFRILTGLGEVLPPETYSRICWAIDKMFPNCHPVIDQVRLHRLAS